MQRRTGLRAHVAPLLVIGIVVATALGLLSDGADPDLAIGSSAPLAGPEFAPASPPAPSSTARSADRSNLDVVDLRNGGAQPADTQRSLGAAGHTGAAVLAGHTAPRFGAARTGQPPAAVRLVLEVVAPRLGRAPPTF